MGGVQGYTTITAPVGFLRGYNPADVATLPQYTMMIRFPLSVYGFKYPLATCPGQPQVPIDVSYIKYLCSDYADALELLLASPDGALYLALQAALAGFLGAPLNYLAFSVTGCMD